MNKTATANRLLVLMILGVILILLGCQTPDNPQLRIPADDNIKFVGVYENLTKEKPDHAVNNEQGISKICNLLRPLKKVEVIPGDTDIQYKIIVVDNNLNYTNLFLSTDSDGNHYVEQSANGIYEISEEDYKSLLSSVKIA